MVQVDPFPKSVVRTLRTPGEALAFMLGFYTAASETVLAGIDEKVPYRLNLEFLDADAQAAFKTAVKRVAKIRRQLCSHPDPKRTKRRKP